ncbi:hypothetical protein [Actinopolymorpha alba]|uniref:hypothetical protein n=1 Tax=Actinopolymorpha alba TaxID=533267 RepID=UPI00036A7508|nr:hypothetical protein [Actinopolymorpha alba]
MTAADSLPPWADDAIGQPLRRFADQLEREFGPSVAVIRRWDDDELVTELIPACRDAMPAIWIDFGSGLQLEVGNGPGGWFGEYDRDDQGVEFVESTVRAIIDGHVTEVFGPNRSRVEVTYADGSTFRSTGYYGLLATILPRPGWLDRGRKVTYPPYR